MEKMSKELATAISAARAAGAITLAKFGELTSSELVTMNIPPIASDARIGTVGVTTDS